MVDLAKKTYPGIDFRVAEVASPEPAQTSQRRWPVPSQSLQLLIVNPTIDRLPLPPQRVHEVVLLASAFGTQQSIWH
jgi:hypothetical protein